MERLKRLDNDKLIDVVGNYRRYGYDEDIRNAAISLLRERGWSMEELEMFGHLNNRNYDDAVKEYNSFRRNTKTAYILLVLSVGALLPAHLIFVYLAYRNQKEFYRLLDKEDETMSFTDPLFYFHRKNRMREQLQGIS